MQIKRRKIKLVVKMTDSEEEEDALLISIFGVAAQFVIGNDESQRSRVKSRRRKIWVRDWVRRRNEFGCYSQLLRELENEVPQLYKNQGDNKLK